MNVFLRLMAFLGLMLIFFFFGPVLYLIFIGATAAASHPEDPAAIKYAVDLSLYNFQTIYFPIAFAAVLFLCAAIAFSFRKWALLVGAVLGISAFLALKAVGDKFKE